MDLKTKSHDHLNRCKKTFGKNTACFHGKSPRVSRTVGDIHPHNKGCI